MNKKLEKILLSIGPWEIFLIIMILIIFSIILRPDYSTGCFRG